MNKATVWIITLAVLLFFILAGLLVPGWVGMEGGLWWLIAGILWLLGIGAALLIWFWLAPKAVAPQQGEDEIDVLVSAARTRLASARGRSAASFRNMPVIIVTGPAGSAKTTIVTRSGMDPELLAGEVVRGDAVVPTAAVNVWYAQNNLVVEVGGKVAGDADRWKRMIRHVQPNRLAAAFTRKRQSPRVAIVCFGCDELLRPGASEGVPATAQRLRARLAEVSQQIGIRLPVYVLFTKADRLPYWDEFIRNFTRDEARDVLGVTLTVPPAGAVGQYAERESRRIADAFATLFRGLAARRLDVLPRETQDIGRSGAYEFPREFRKTTDLATQFLLDLCRPSQLGVSPFLRGFYFTGVRAVFVHDVGAASAQPAPSGAGGMMDATGVFDPRALQQQAMAQQAIPAAGSRRVPEWVFLDRVFREVVLRDDVARGVTAGGTRVNFFRRASIAAAAMILLVLAVGMTVSWFGNRGVQRRTRTAMDGVSGIARAGALAELDALQRLDALRVQADQLDRWRRDGQPRRLGWFLYAGNRIQQPVRDLYFNRFDALLWDQTRNTLRDYLVQLPDTPTVSSDYDLTYNALKAYLSTTARTDQADSAFLGPQLTTFWSQRGAVDADRRSLAHAQFAFFGHELPFDHPFPAQSQTDSSLVDKTRGLLDGFTGVDQLYGQLLRFARDSAPSVAWTDQAVVRNDVIVPGEFTRQGWDRAETALNDVRRLFEGEEWVLGESRAPPEDVAQTQQQLAERYRNDYIEAWLGFLRAGRIASFGTAREASGRLRTLAGPPSPIINMIGLVSTHTDMDSTNLIRRSFQPVHALATPNPTNPALPNPTEPAGRYVGLLAQLQSNVEQASGSGPAAEGAQSQAFGTAAQINTTVTGMAQSFGTEAHAPTVGSAVRTLLLLPVGHVEGALGRISADVVNESGPAFCAPFGQLGAKYPFNPSANVEAQMNEVIELLSPSGALVSFFDDRLTNLMTRRGTSYAAQPGASPAPNPAFVTWYNQMAQIANALFETGREEPEFNFTLRLPTPPEVSQIDAAIAGSSVTWTRTNVPIGVFTWGGSVTAGAQIRARFGDQDVTVANQPPGSWSVFRLFAAASRYQRTSTTNAQVIWTPAGRNVPITGELTMTSGFHLLEPGVLRVVGRCVSRIAR